MKETPIIFTTESVRAILDGRKTQTRRVIKPQPPSSWSIPPARFYQGYCNEWGCHVDVDSIKCPYGQVGDRLWAKETWTIGDVATVYYKATDLPVSDNPWESPRFMPRWASRITLEITEVRVERLQEISNEDARAEGVIPLTCCLPGAAHYITPFKELWDSLNAKRGYGWEVNPWVWVISFATGVRLK